MEQTSDARPLIESIRARIAASGPVSFRWFMEQALYDPAQGYYASGRAATGRRGDYLTNVSVGPMFGRLMARQFVQAWELMGCPPGFALIEQGAHDGQFARDVFRALRVEAPDLHAMLRYVIVEPLPHLRALQQTNLGDIRRGKVRHFHALDEIDTGSLNGVHFSNELLDSMPVHRVRYIGDRWYEEFVELDGDKFRSVYAPPAGEALARFLERMPPAPLQGYRTEVNLRALGWVDDVARVLRRGYVLTIDYGYPRARYLDAARSDGTLSCYCRHRRIADPFQHIGEVDITSHVEFTSLAEHAAACGLVPLGFVDQHRFIVGAAQRWLLEQESAGADRPDQLSRSEIRQLQTLLHPSAMGASFSCLLLGRDVPRAPLPSGFRHAPPARAALGLAEP